ncbi:site-specific integrase [Paenibacillus sp. F6_3S_P_1C]|uniref:Site-specific integrase n=1 Tax=Paenibacillus vandeheii TaxID=3035917 RepID=A0ABT8J4T2_9BACL|nr:site-specific integrase [Paenibacillus vandeheii]MDN4600007.1 site-specific integrase [Paenibacillus vandeheii]
MIFLGYVEKRGKNTWRMVVVTGYEADGVTQIRERDKITIDDPDILKSPKKTKEYLQDALRNFTNKVLASNYVKPEKLTFNDFVFKDWYNNYARDELSPATLEVYQTHLDSRLIPRFGHMQLGEIKSMHILNFLKDLEQPGARLDGKSDGLDAGTIGYIYRVLKNILSRAKEWNYIETNPMEGVKKPKDKNARAKQLMKLENPQYYEEKEAQLVVDALYKESRKWRLLILGSMFGGWRRGELIALEWPNVNFEEGTLTVNNNIPLSKNGKAIEKSPKSISSHRNVDFPEWYMKELEDYYDEWIRERKRLGTKWLGGDRQYVFHNGEGNPYYYQHPSKWWRRFCTRHEIRYIKFHGLRHSSGTLLLEDESENNFDSILKVIQERLGHSRLSTSADIYVHATKKIKKRSANKFDKFSRNPKEEN